MEQAQNTVYNLSLSTMWAMTDRPSLIDFFQRARQMGFAAIELNHQVDSSLLAGLDLRLQPISSIHEPCPADIPVSTLKSRDWLISAEDEANRRQGVIAMMRSIDLAASLGIKAIVVHCGSVRSNWPLEFDMYRLYKNGHTDGARLQELRGKLQEQRGTLVPTRLEAVRKSLGELLEYARPRGVRLGLENRYHFMDIPMPDEMEMLLSLAGPAELGFWYDVGHAQTLDRLGFTAHAAWLERFGDRIVGVHLHDAVGITDHDSPGAGEIDFDWISRYIPAGAILTLEVRPELTPEQLIHSLAFLAKRGCIHPV